jgi:serine/threonine protein kinase
MEIHRNILKSRENRLMESPHSTTSTKETKSEQNIGMEEDVKKEEVVKVGSLQQVDEINRLIRMKVKQERKRMEEGRRSYPEESLDWVEIMSKVMSIASVKKYTKVKYLGEGSYSTVYKVKHPETTNEYAMKKFKFVGTEMSLSTIREIKALMLCDHPNIVKFIEICSGRWKNELAMVIEYVETDLLDLMRKRKTPFERQHIKSFLYQSLSAINYLHKKRFIHRDIKLSNFLLNEQGDLKLADFGLARGCDEDDTPDAKFTSTVATLWYRAPELLLGETRYGGAVDMWAAGCVFAELLRSKELFSGSSDLSQLHCIFSLLGTPKEEEWPTFRSLPVCDVISFTSMPDKDGRKDLALLFPDSPILEFDLLANCLIYNPEKRITAADALQHAYFTTLPLPCKYIASERMDITNE